MFETRGKVALEEDERGGFWMMVKWNFIRGRRIRASSKTRGGSWSQESERLLQFRRSKASQAVKSAIGPDCVTD